MFGEEYTLVSIADYVLSHTPQYRFQHEFARALSDITANTACNITLLPLARCSGKMKETQAVIGGEGNGGVIYPHRIMVAMLCGNCVVPTIWQKR